MRKQLWQDPVVAPVVEDLAEDLVEVASAVAEAASAEDLAEADLEAVITTDRILVIIIARASLVLAPVITTAVADALAVFSAP